MDTQIIINPSDQELDMLALALRNGELGPFLQKLYMD